MSSSRTLRLLGKVAVTCGSTQGIGFAAARRMAQEGAKVIISSRIKNNVEEATKALTEEGLDVKGVVCHISKSEQRANLLEEAQKLGGIDILFVNAGVNPAFMGIMDCSESAWDKSFDVNVKAPFLLTKEALPQLKQKGCGRIIYNATISCWNHLEDLGVYSVTKLALLGLTKQTALQLARYNITVNAVAPGYIDTGFAQVFKSKPEVERTVLGRIPLRRIGTPEEVANVVAFLASDESSYITGEAIPVAGGMMSRI